MNLMTNKLLLVSSIIIGLTYLSATFWEDMGFGRKEAIALAFSMMLAFGVNVAGLIFSFSERKKNKMKSQIGLIGHLILIIGFLAMSVYSAKMN